MAKRLALRSKFFSARFRCPALDPAVHFWETQRAGQNDMTVLKEVRENFGRDPRFVLISLACGKDAAQAEQSIKQDGLNWTHGFAGDCVTGAATRYRIRAIAYSFNNAPDQRYLRIPLTFLIGPDGRIVAHDLRGTMLVQWAKRSRTPSSSPRTRELPLRLQARRACSPPRLPQRSGRRARIRRNPPRRLPRRCGCSGRAIRSRQRCP